jgi:hypothetical protein
MCFRRCVAIRKTKLIEAAREMIALENSLKEGLKTAAQATPKSPATPKS